MSAAKAPRWRDRAVGLGSTLPIYHTFALLKVALSGSVRDAERAAGGRLADADTAQGVLDLELGRLCVRRDDERTVAGDGIEHTKFIIRPAFGVRWPAAARARRVCVLHKAFPSVERSGCEPVCLLARADVAQTIVMPAMLRVPFALSLCAGVSSCSL